MAEEHRATVAAALHSLQAANASNPARSTQQAWRWIERHNKAAAYPTDFGLLACNPAVVDALKVRTRARWSLFCAHPARHVVPRHRALPWSRSSCRGLQACLLREARVKDIHPDRQLTRSLAWDSSGGAFGGSLHHDASDGTIRKRPGR